MLTVLPAVGRKAPAKKTGLEPLPRTVCNTVRITAPFLKRATTFRADLEIAMILEDEKEREDQEAQDEESEEVAERVVMVEDQTRDWAAASGTTRQGMLLHTQQPSGVCHFASP